MADTGQSSACTEARWLPVLAIAAATAVAGCGGSHNEQRDQLEGFIKNVNSVQHQSAPAFARANRAYVAFSKGKLPPKAARKDLAAAEDAMRTTRDRVQNLAPPAQARELQRRLVVLFDTDASFAHETTLLATFVPASVAALKPLNRIGKALQRDLGGAKGATRQEAALRRYAAATQRVVRRLQPLKPPPILLARHSAQVEHLISARRLALSLASALNAQDSRRVARL